jgi:hypothetical protein
LLHLNFSIKCGHFLEYQIALSAFLKPVYIWAFPKDRAFSSNLVLCEGIFFELRYSKMTFLKPALISGHFSQK